MDEREILAQLNAEQGQAVLATDGPVLILAGAGSGKTRVLVHRIAYLIDVKGVQPGNILAITFTNKAAGEMRSRVDGMIGFGAGAVWVSTFHSLCVRILKRYGELLGYTRYFSIYDTDDQLTLMKELFREKHIDTRYMKERAVLARISSAKDELISPKKYRVLHSDYYGEKVAELYEAYQEKLLKNNAMDFDDLIVNAVRLFEEHPDVLGVYEERFRYLMVDEYQDTNTAQFRFISLLAGRCRNLCVVGDDDQSIYKFRGANIRNILDFEKIFPDAKVIRLERNYRSTRNILDAANEVIKNNRGRKQKHLWTEAEAGEKLHLRRFRNGFEEAGYVAGEISAGVRQGKRAFRDYAVLYRTNAQSRLLEEKMLLANIPYRIVGGVNFYSRREIKDILAYLKTIDNGDDDLQVRRIINVPRRGIGASTLEKISGYAEAGGISFFAGACAVAQVPGVGAAAAKKVTGFTDMIAVLRARAELGTVSELIKQLLELTGYAEELKKENTEEAKARLENIDELISKAVQYETNAGNPSLSAFLEEVALVADIDSLDEDDDRVLLMTLHAAKGLEFPAVFMCGMEDGLFPSDMSLDSDTQAEEMEEERRLCYVGITRAKESLTLTSAAERMVRGEVKSHEISRFVREIPRSLVDLGDEQPGMGRKLDLSGSGADELLWSALTGRTEAGAGGRGTAGRSGRDSGFGAFGFGDEAAGSGTGSASGWGRTTGRRTIRNAYDNPYKKAASLKAAGVKETPAFQVGDRVSHVKFGVGEVREIRDGGKDYLVTVDFPSWGVKKMYASFAKLKPV